MIERARYLSKVKEQFDVLVIGGGATGCGIALDAISRGLKVCLVERGDFGSGTSSRSTKLIHGGVRYLELAVKHFDRTQFHLVREALHERSTLCRLAPHLVHKLALVTPLYQWLDLPYYTLGLQLYDRLAGKSLLSPSQFLSAKEALRRFPMLKEQKLHGAVLYYDGQFDDARMNITLALTACKQGAALLNHMQVNGLHIENGKVEGVIATDQSTGENHLIRAHATINATGPFLDSIRKLEDSSLPDSLSVSSGTHIVLGKRFSPPDAGLLIPKTKDGRVLFLLPWEGHTLVGTTDNPATVERDPKPTPTDIEYILEQLKTCFALRIAPHDILSSWTGLRPLLREGSENSTAKLSRDYHILEGKTGLLSIGGGKWTTYRKMAEAAVDNLIQRRGLRPSRPCQTETLRLVGSDASLEAVQKTLQNSGLPEVTVTHLYHSYGSLAEHVFKFIQKHPGLLHPGHPYCWGELAYGIEVEGALRLSDLLARRIRLLFVDWNAALEILEKTAEFCIKNYGWNANHLEIEMQQIREGKLS